MSGRCNWMLVGIGSFLAFLVVPMCASAQQAKVRIGDKTLVAWVQLVNLDQRAGSVLTLQDLREFDGIVFAEVRPRTWMPGSHVFHRTNTRQESWPVETAAPDRIVQVAIVYRGAKISLARDGQLVAEYETDRPHVFEPPLRVAIGIRHLAPFGLPDTRFAGTIEEARIYDRALSRDELASLKPGKPSSIKPLAQWSFEDGSTLVEQDRVIALYHGTTVGNIVAVSSDPLLLNWQKIPGNPVIPIVPLDENSGRPYRVYDPCIWREGDRYFALSGTFWKGAFFRDCVMVQQLFSSGNLRRWEYLGPLVEGTPYTEPGEDGAVPYFWPIGDKHILVFASHKRGSQYLLGDYDKATHKFHPFAHGRFNFGMIGPGGVHAPSATPNEKGGICVIHNVNEARPTAGWNHLMSLVRVLTLRQDNTLGIEPVAAIQTLRQNRASVGEMWLPAGREIVLKNIAGNAMEIQAELDPRDANEVCLTVLRSPGKEETTDVRFRRKGYAGADAIGQRVTRDAIVIDATRASLHRNVQRRPPEIAPFELTQGELLKLRIFVDRSIVEVIANDRQCVALRVYPQRPDSVGVSISAQNADASLRRLDAWQMKSIYETTP